MVFTLDEKFDTVAKMKVIGVGGAGGNAVNRMIAEGLTGVEFISVNTDVMAIDNNRATHRIQIGERITKGLGAGANPDIGKIAMEEDKERIAELIEGADMVFITAGMGGGTGTGGTPVVAEVAKEMNILTVAIVTRPFLFEGKIRDRNARDGISELRKSVDTIIIIQNQKLLSIVDRDTPLIDAFKTADEVLHNATKGISDLISVHGLVNLDFADVKTIMRGMGDAIMGSGTGEGENRAALAADAAIHSPMLDDVSIAGAKGILINITGGNDLTLYDVGDATQAVYDAVGEGEDANIIFGAVNDPEMEGKIQVTIIATGFNENGAVQGNKENKITNIKKGFESGKAPVDKSAQQLSFKLEERNIEDIKDKEVTSPLHIVDKNKEVEKDVSDSSLPPENSKASNPDGIAADTKQIDVAEVKNYIKEEEDADQKSMDLPVVVKTGNYQKEQVFVSKGQVMTHLEDDIDVPTFLRKQMQ
jgi:cell division protein FtsZ